MGRRTLDFFGQRDNLRRQTALLILLFALAVAAVVVAVHLATQLLFSQLAFFDFHAKNAAVFSWNWPWFWRVGTLTLSIIVGGTIYKLAELHSGGGKAVAEGLGGTEVDPSTSNPLERRLVNIASEMAIASGVSMPRVYLLKRETGINAFAAGLSHEDAVIGVTRGALERLSREELQGVVAHEFSHILNSDARLNINLMGWLHGIMMVAQVGWRLMRPLVDLEDAPRGKRGGAGFGLFFGLLLFLAGLIGYFLARLIQVAVSRRREYLADAHAVQFTRNPLGLAGALKKIGGFETGGSVAEGRAFEAAHLFFDNPLTGFLAGLFSTHPPLAERIAALDPEWKQEFNQSVEFSFTPEAFAALADEEKAREAARPLSRAGRERLSPSAVADLVGAPGEAELERAVEVLKGVDDHLLASARRPDEASALLLALLLSGEPEIRKVQLERVAAQGGREMARKAEELKEVLVCQKREVYLPLVEISAPSLDKLSGKEAALLCGLLEDLSRADGKLDTFELALTATAGRRLEKTMGLKHNPKLSDWEGDIAILLYLLAVAGADDDEKARRAFMRGQLELGGLGAKVKWPEGAPPEPADFQAAARRLAALPGARKRFVVKAFAAVVMMDGEVAAGEEELMRAGAGLMGVPVPPLRVSDKRWEPC